MARLRLAPVEYKVCPQCSVAPPAEICAEGVPIDDAAVLQVGHAVIHQRYGPGMFGGIESLNVQGTEEEYLRLAYIDGVLYVPGKDASRLLRLATDAQLQPSSLVAFQMEYEGQNCPRCGHPSDVRTHRRLHRRLILVPPYERQERLHCPNTECAHLYELPLDWDAVREAKRLLGNRRLLQEKAQAQRVDERILRQQIEAQLDALRCPYCDGRPPIKPATVWVRVFDPDRPLRELQQQEWVEGLGDKQEEAPEELDTEEVNNNDTTHNA